jgi:hypothetical protein
MLLLLLTLLSIASFTAASSKWPPHQLPIHLKHQAPLRTRVSKPQKSIPNTPTLLTHSLPAPTSFCKCTCFSNSTIIPLDPSKSSSGTGAGLNNKLYERAFSTEELENDLSQQQQQRKQQQQQVEVDTESESESGTDAGGTITERAQKYRALSCNDCNRKFCLDYELPICKDAKEEDVFTTCFRKLPMVDYTRLAIASLLVYCYTYYSIVVVWVVGRLVAIPSKTKTIAHDDTPANRILHA